MQTFVTSEKSKGVSAVTMPKNRQQSFFAPVKVQPRLIVGASDVPCEREADAMSDKVMQMPAKPINPGFRSVSPSFFTKAPLPDSPVQRQCASCREEEKLQRKSDVNTCEGIDAPLQVYDVLNSGGQPLDAGTRNFFEPRFGQDFSNVKIHTGNKAAESSHSINAQAYTSGIDIVFSDGKYSPDSEAGKKLLGHELAHVVQQSKNQTKVQRNIIDDLKATAEETAKKRLVNLANKPVITAGAFTGHAGCHSNFCQPFPTVAGAVVDLAWAGPLILAGIATKVNPRVVPLWALYISGGSGPQNLTASFGNDFTNSPTTVRTSKFLISELRKDVETNRTVLLGGSPVATVDFTPRLTGALAAIDDPVGANQMNFNIPADIAGNIAGGIGKDETLFPIGAKPSPFNDSREAVINATLTANSDGSTTVIPSIKFTVKDTIDLCPGDCGTSAEQVATVPLSRFEATGLAGDIPMIIEFDAPATELLPFTIGAAPAAVTTGKVTASALNIRSAPNTSSSLVGSYPKNTIITLRCQTAGTTIDGNNVWYQTHIGYVSSRYVLLSGLSIPTSC